MSFWFKFRLNFELINNGRLSKSIIYQLMHNRVALK